jgi:serine O-acetyltransferase
VYLIKSDTYRSEGSASARSVLRMLLRSPMARFILIVRLAQWSRSEPGHRVARLLTRLAYGRSSMHHHIEIPFSVHIGPAFYIQHRIGGILVNQNSHLGAGVTLSPGVVIGNKGGGDPRGPHIGDRVMLDPGSMVIGPISVGADCHLGAGAIVVKDLPAGSVAVGVPARVLEAATPHPVKFTDYESVLGPPPDDLGLRS